MNKHPSEMTIGELMAMRAANSARGGPTVHSFYDEGGALWNITTGLALQLHSNLDVSPSSCSLMGSSP